MTQGEGRGRWRGDWPPSSGPRKVTGGIKARSKRGAIGEQWWSRRFLEVLESFGLQGRLARGRNYARSGQVLTLEVSTGYVRAQVQGSRVRPYKVELQLLPLTKRQWRQVEQALAGRAVFRARLLAGEMPAEIEQVFADCHEPLFPRSLQELEMFCSCPDWEVPCKHLAAVCYVLAERFDEDPFALLAWRGKGRDELLAGLRRSADAEAELADGPLAGIADRPLAESLSQFWSAGLTEARLRALPPVPRAPADLVLRSFDPPLLQLAGQDLVTLLTPAYRLMAAEDGEDGE